MNSLFISLKNYFSNFPQNIDIKFYLYIVIVVGTAVLYYRRRRKQCCKWYEKIDSGLYNILYRTVRTVMHFISHFQQTALLNKIIFGITEYLSDSRKIKYQNSNLRCCWEVSNQKFGCVYDKIIQKNVSQVGEVIGLFANTTLLFKSMVYGDPILH